ncbi:ATP-binding protein [Agromyces bauzanensis]|uniref:Nuclease SbcCD subunit C n=1 Tax=Agromyces bauzanensis TaxID=1308924 RepID=A0A917PVZ2_9MICO|nr:ATP-binding protein [Agromyces bauzanensis]GGJ94145.1 hypothetical protein GCM10011372_35590 [Agromyces bauzanensis]
MLDRARWIVTRLDADDSLTDEEQLIILAALEGDDTLADLASFEPPERVTPDSGAVEPVEPAGAFLKRIKVQGFRGIGPKAQLDLKPAPGLTVVAGRNGSGKSSFAEALEFALLGTTARWQERRGAAWDGAWRNLHEGDPASIEVTLAEEQVGTTTVSVTWAADAARDAHSTHLQRAGQKRETGVSSLGWDVQLETYRPILTYDELGAILTSEPSKLYDKLASVLGLEQLAAAVKRLESRARQLGAPEKDAAERKRAVTQTLQQLGDERATSALSLLKKRDPDVAALRALATGVGDGGVRQADDAAHAVLQLKLPAADEVGAVTDALRAATEAAASAGDSATAALELRTDVLHAALRVHQHQGDGPCPVCATGRVDDDWAERARIEIQEAEVALSGLRAASAALRSARANAVTLIASVPSVLDRLVADAELGELAELARELWAEWAEVPDGNLDLAEHLAAKHPLVTEALAELQRAARRVIDARDDAWSAAATQLGAFLDAHERWAAKKSDAASAKRAVKWLKDHDSELKNERLAPIAEQAKEIWSYLRQESNVEIARLKLDGSNTRPHVVIEASVDDKDAADLTVLSQGELHALAVALFLPRAKLPESPFRFVVLDDPVQAMDPAKVDGLVRVLAKIAEQRQVIVFSHDDRFADAVRRGQVNAQILEVTRENGSRVTVTNAFDPPRRYLRDAAALLRDGEMPDDALRRVLPGILRFAVEAQARDSYFTEALSKGQPHAEVERIWADHPKTTHRVSLALYGDIRSLDGWLAKRADYRKPALGICTSGAHSSLGGDPRFAHDAVEKFVDDIRNGVR